MRDLEKGFVGFRTFARLAIALCGLTVKRPAEEAGGDG
jgi:hypothetical protein